MSTIRAIAATVCLTSLASAVSAQPVFTYQYGVMPEGASYSDAKAAYDGWVANYVTNAGSPNPQTMLYMGRNNSTTSEYMGHSMILMAIFDTDDSRLEKMWNYVNHYSNKGGDKEWQSTMAWRIQGGRVTYGIATDGDVDIATACDYAARKWGGPWSRRAIDRLNGIKKHTRTPTTEKPTKGYPTDRNYTFDALKDGKGVKGYYLNYLPFAIFDRYEDRTGDTDWALIKEGCYQLLEVSYEKYHLPAWFTNWLGDGATPNDPWNSKGDRWDAGPSRTGWRLPQAYLWEGNPRSKKWAEKINDVYVQNGHINDYETGFTNSTPDDRGRLRPAIGWGYSYRTGQRKDPGINSYMVGVAGISAMAAGNQVGADNCWRWMKEQNLSSGTIKHLEATLHVIYMAVMCGAFDCSVGGTSTARDFPVYQPVEAASYQRGGAKYGIVTLHGRGLPFTADFLHGPMSAQPAPGLYVRTPDGTNRSHGKTIHALIGR